ncbi:hypothetical protein J437_LFUL014280 [Ladona fulva]|uniref:Endonuclease/exonuclease/phosphatase domain-containing protein n=1 Tax=Ladona fulva TaxID=123851 RepID=A0A8K0P9V1_LADFU|nr:hypothetical protein J437_LFUL014280 [Ladona fulva]
MTHATKRTTIWKKKDKLRIGKLNIRSLDDKEQELIEELQSHQISICALQETKKKGKGQREYGKYFLIYSGVEKSVRAKAGVEIIIHKNDMKYIEGCRYISERIVAIKMKTNRQKLNIISVYGPEDCKPKADKEAFYDHLQDAINTIPPDELLILMGDFNARSSSSTTAPPHHCIIWPKFLDFLINKLPHYPLLPESSTKENIDTQIDLLNDLLISAKSAASKPLPPKPPHFIPLPNNLRQLMTHRNRLRMLLIHRKDRATKQSLHNLQKIIKSEIRRLTDQNWTSFTNSLSFEDNSLWKAAKKLSGPNNFNQPILIDDELNFDPCLKAEFDATEISKSMSNNPSNPSTDPTSEITYEWINQFQPNDFPPFTTKLEVLTILQFDGL